MASLKLPFTPITKSNGFLVTANKACVDIITKTMNRMQLCISLFIINLHRLMRRLMDEYF